MPDHPSIVLIGIGGGGSRILSDSVEKILEYKVVDRYECIARAIRAEAPRPLTFIVDTSTDPTRKGFFENIPADQKISLSDSAKGMSRGAGGRPGRAAKAMLNAEVVDNLAKNLYKPIFEARPAIVVIIHTADGGTGGGLTPEILLHIAYSSPMSTIFWVFTVLPQRTALSLKGPRTVAPVMGRLLKIARRISKADFTNIPYTNREIIDSHVPRQEKDQSYEFQHSRVAIFPVSNEHFAQCWKEEFSKKEIREEVLNPVPIEVLSQALYPYLKYAVADTDQQKWMQKNWPLGPIDIPDIMAGLTPVRPFVIPHLWLDPKIDDQADMDRVLNDLETGNIDLKQIDVLLDDGIPDLFTFSGTSARLYESRVTSLYCIPVYPEGSKYFDEISDFVADRWFPQVSDTRPTSSPNPFRGLPREVSWASITQSWSPCSSGPSPTTCPSGWRPLGTSSRTSRHRIFGRYPATTPPTGSESLPPTSAGPTGPPKSTSKSRAGPVPFSDQLLHGGHRNRLLHERGSHIRH